MNKKLFGTILSIVLIVAGCIISYFAKFDVVQISAFAVTMFSAGLAVNQLWTGRSEGAKTWLVILGIALVGIGAFSAGLFSVIVFIAG